MADEQPSKMLQEFLELQEQMKKMPPGDIFKPVKRKSTNRYNVGTGLRRNRTLDTPAEPE